MLSKDRYLTAARLAEEASNWSMQAAISQEAGEEVGQQLQELRHAASDAELAVSRAESALASLHAEVEAKKRFRDEATAQVCVVVGVGVCLCLCLYAAGNMYAAGSVMICKRFTNLAQTGDFSILLLGLLRSNRCTSYHTCLR